MVCFQKIQTDEEFPNSYGDIESPIPLSPPASFKDNAGDYSNEEMHLNDYIQNHRIQLPDLEETSADSDDIEEEFQSIYSAATQDDSSWAENWMLRSRNQRDGSPAAKAISPPVGMLVPSPTHDIKTQIGDQNADEISDLSEAGSEDESDNYERPSIDVPHVLVNSKIRIGGKNEAARLEHDMFEVASLVSDSSLTRQSPIISEAKNEYLLFEDNGNDYVRSVPVIHLLRDDPVQNGTNGDDIGPVPAPR